MPRRRCRVRARPSDSQFQKLVTERIAAGNPEREDSPTYLLKRLKQLEQENAALRQKKRIRPRTPLRN